MRHAVESLSRNSTKLASSCSSPVKPSMSSARRRLKMCVCPMLIVPRLLVKTRVVIIIIQKDIKEDVILGILVELQLLR